MRALTAPAFLVTRRPIGRETPDPQPLNRVPDDAWVTAVATVTTAHVHSTGSSARVMLGLTADNNTVAVARIDASTLRYVPDFLRTPGARVEIRGVVKHRRGMASFIELAGIAPEPTPQAVLAA